MLWTFALSSALSYRSPEIKPVKFSELLPPTIGFNPEDLAFEGAGCFVLKWPVVTHDDVTVEGTCYVGVPGPTVVIHNNLIEAWTYAPVDGATFSNNLFISPSSVPADQPSSRKSKHAHN